MRSCGRNACGRMRLCVGSVVSDVGRAILRRIVRGGRVERFVSTGFGAGREILRQVVSKQILWCG